jgi:hypothetical protein
MFALDKLCRLSEDTYRSLQIFQRGVHPSMVKASGDREMGSLFGTMNACKTKTGGKLVRQHMHFPRALPYPVVISPSIIVATHVMSVLPVLPLEVAALLHSCIAKSPNSSSR